MPSIISPGWIFGKKTHDDIAWQIDDKIAARRGGFDLFLQLSASGQIAKTRFRLHIKNR